MDLVQKKSFLKKELSRRGHGAGSRLARFCGVKPRQVVNWTSLKTTAWPSVKNQEKLCEFLGIPADAFYGDQEPALLRSTRESSSGDTQQILGGVQEANAKLDVVKEKLDRLTTQLGQAIPVVVPEKELPRIDSTVLKLREQIHRLRSVPGVPELHGLTQICQDLEHQLSSLRAQERPPYT
jgi:transcriptional regulator with XRE-family HTH domain